MPAYGQSLDMYMEIVVDSAKHVNKIQMALLIAEGLGVCSLLVLWSWMRLKDVARLRHGVFSIFTVRP
jgi:hypothetical protein